MKQLFDFLASLKLAVILLVLLLVGLSAGTIVETRAGVETAGRMVYYSPWFLGLQGLFALNLALSISDLFPWTKKRIGFVTTHAALLLIFIGSAGTYFLKTEGTLRILEGETASVIEHTDAAGNLLSSHQLPFAVKLDSFVLDTYPGTMRPAGFASHVQITDAATRQTFPAKIWMNNELHYRGYALFQSSYSQEGGRQATVLSVAKDPGQIVVFAGYLALILGMVIVLFTRIGQAREAAAMEARDSSAGRTALLALLLLCGAATASAAGPAPMSSDMLRSLPVQHDGRVMPLDTMAREVVWNVTGSRSFQGQDAVALVTQWLYNPDACAAAPIVSLGSKAFVKALELPDGTTHASFMTILSNPKARDLVLAARAEEEAKRPRVGLVQEAEKLEQRLIVLQGVLTQKAVRPVPILGDPKAQWNLPTAVTHEGLMMLLAGPRPQGWPSAEKMDEEVLYNRVNPGRWSWIILLGALAVSIVAGVRKSKVLDGVAFGVLVAGFAMMSWGILLRWHAGERIPAANMYESMLFLAWGVGAFAVLAYAVLRNRVVVLNAAVMAALTMALTDLLPIDKFIHPIAPVLAGTPWLAIHVPIIMVSYAILALGLVVAHMQIGVTIFAPRRADLIEKFYDLLYWYMFVGSIFLIAGIITGSMWAASSWGRYWGWDPKEVWSLVAFLAYMAILHAKLDRLIGKFGVALISIAAFQTIIMTYLGVNFVLTTGMHSYGMGDSPVVMWMLLVGLAEALFLGAGLVAHRRNLAR